MSPRIAFGELMPLALAASAAAGLAGVVSLALLVRLSYFKRSANARFILWFVLLVSLCTVGPAFFAGGTIWLQRVPVVRIHTAASKNVAPSLAENPDAIRAYRQRNRAVQLQAAVPTRRAMQVRPDLISIFDLLLMGGFIISFVRIGLGIARLKRLVKRADLVEMRSTSRGVIRILAANAFSVPIAVGYRHPAVILPPAMLEFEHETDRENVLLHEIEHLRRFDDVTCLVQALCMGMLWFNPFAYHIARKVTVEREMACDEAVVISTGRRVRYAQTLWKIATNGLEVPAPSITSAFSSPSHMVVRLKNILNERAERRRGHRSFAVAFAALLPLILVSTAAAVPAMLLRAPTLVDFTSVRLCPGRTLVIGGRISDGSAVDSAQLYDARGRRLAVIPMHVARWSAEATILRNGDVLVTGGMTLAGATADAELYHLDRRTFEEVGAMNVARAEHTATLLRNGDVIIAAGRGNSGFVRQTEIYRTKLHRFQFTADGAGRVAQTALLVDKGDVLMFTGLPWRGYMGCAIIYDSRLHTYRNAGTFLRAGSRTLTFELPDGRIVTHHIQTA